MHIFLAVVLCLSLISPASADRQRTPIDHEQVEQSPPLVDFGGDWIQIPDAAVNDGPAIVFDDNDVLHIAMRTADDEISYRTRSAGGVLSTEENLGGRTRHKPDIAYNPVTGEVIIVVRGIDGRIYQNTKPLGGTWSGWHVLLFGATNYSPSVATNSMGETTVAVRSSIDSTIWLNAGDEAASPSGVCTTKTVTLEQGFPPNIDLADLTIENLCDGVTLRMRVNILSSNTGRFFFCSFNFQFVQNAAQFSGYSIIPATPGASTCASNGFFPGTIVEFDLVLNQGIVLDFTQPFSVFLFSEHILDFG